MPVVHTHDAMPPWSELLRYEILRGPAGSVQTLPPSDLVQKVVVVDGRIRLGEDGGSDLRPGDAVELGRQRPDSLTFLESSTVVWLSGRWSEDTGRSGVFTPHDIASPVEGDPVDYPKETEFDNHFHDCDEHWIIVEGAGTVVTEGVHYEVGPGDCVSTRTGDHHDFPLVTDPVRAVFFETSMVGEKRPGHLWEHTHGPAEPVRLPE